MERAVLFRAGGYWWDGETWYRPSQVMDMTTETYYDRVVPGAVGTSVVDLLTTGNADAGRGRILRLDDLDPAVGMDGEWLEHLAAWVERQPEETDLRRSIVGLTAPELAAEALIDTTEFARTADISASTLRAYISRGEAGVPAPQAVLGGRNMWAKPVAEDWVEVRRRTRDGLESAVGAERLNHSWPVGILGLWDRCATVASPAVGVAVAEPGSRPRCCR